MAIKYCNFIKTLKSLKLLRRLIITYKQTFIYYIIYLLIKINGWMDFALNQKSYGCGIYTAILFTTTYNHAVDSLIQVSSIQF